MRRERKTEREREHQLQKQRESSLANLPCVFYRRYLHTAGRGRITVRGWKNGRRGDGSRSENTGTSRLRARYRIIYVCT